MKLFIIRFLLFIAIPLTALCALEWNIHNLHGELFSEEALESVFVASDAPYAWVRSVPSSNIVALAGSSTVRYGLSCSRLNDLSSPETSFVNLSMNARDPVETYFILKQMDTSRIRRVFFGLDPWIYSKRYYVYRDPYLYLDLTLPQSTSLYLDLDSDTFRKRYTAFFGHIIPALRKATTRDAVTVIPADFGSVALDRTPVNFNEPVEEVFGVDRYGWSPIQFEYLSKIADLCKQRGIDFAAFIPPKRSDFTARYRDKCREIHAAFVDHAVNAGFHGPVFGTFDQLDSAGDQDLFAEAFHLNARGQAVYSDLFFTLMQKPMQNFSRDYTWYQADKP